MSGPERFDRMVELARRESAPTPDVTGAVRARVAELRSAVAPELPLGLTLACAAAALAIGLMGFWSWRALCDPWLGWLLGLGAGWLL